MVFTCTNYQSADVGQQGRILSQVAKLIDTGVLRTTVAEVLRPIDSANLHRALTTLQQGHVLGKIVLSGFEG